MMDALNSILINALLLCALLSGVPLIVTSCISLLVSLLQAVTQVQEQTVQFIVKLSVMATVLLCGGTIGFRLLCDFCLSVLQSFKYFSHAV